jgi:MATE family multidrug resistance protein
MNNKVTDFSDPGINEPLIPELQLEENVVSVKKSQSEYIVPKSKFHIDIEISYLEAFLNLFKSAIPSILALMFVFINDSINIIYAGKYYTNDHVSAIGLGAFYANAVGFIFGIGLIGRLDTLCSQSFGAKQYYIVGIFVNICRLCLFVFNILIILPLIFACGPIMRRIGVQNETIIGLTSSYVLSLIPYTFFSLQSNVNLRYLQSMNYFLPTMFITLITSLLHPIWCYLILSLSSIGISGIGLAMGITSLLNFSLGVLYIHYKNPYPETYFLYDENCLQLRRIYDFLKMAVPAAVMFAANYLGIELIILFSSYLDENSMAANVVFFSIISLIGTIPLGLSFATSTYVGNSIGNSRINTAKIYSFVSTISGFIIIMLVSCIVMLFRTNFPFIYINDLDLAQKIRDLLPLYLFFGPIDALQLILHGIVKGLGMQRTAWIIVLFILYPINVPFALTLCFVVNYGLDGLWMAQLSATILLVASYLILILCVDWDNLAIRTIVKINAISSKLLQKGKRLVHKDNAKLN